MPTRAALMPHLHITIDDQTVLDGDLGEWTTNPPQLITEQLTNPKPQPGMKALMLALTEAAIHNQPTHINLQNRPNGWTLQVDMENG